MGISSCNKLLGDRWIFLMKQFLKCAAGGAFSPQEQFADGEPVSGCTIAACYFCVTTPWLISDGKPLIIPLDLRSFFACQRQGRQNCARRTFVSELT